MSYTNNSLFSAPYVKSESELFPNRKYELKSDLVSQTNDIVFLGERRYYLNKSKCKFVSIGLSYVNDYIPHIKLSGYKRGEIFFKWSEWSHFLSYQGIITNYLYSHDKPESINTEDFSIDFEQFSNIRVIKITKSDGFLYLGYETICKLWELLPLIKYRADMLTRQQFGNYFRVLQRGLRNQGGNVFVNADNILKPEENPNSENLSLVMEFMNLYPDMFERECTN